MTDLRRELKRWITEMSPVTRVGGVVLIVGASIDLFYHGFVEPFLPLPGMQQTLIAYAGHLITFAGMVIMLLSVAGEAWRQTRSARQAATPPDSVSTRRR